MTIVLLAAEEIVMIFLMIIEVARVDLFTIGIGSRGIKNTLETKKRLCRYYRYQ